MSANGKEVTYDYSYRGKCLEMTNELCDKDPTLILQRGYYHCPIWGKQSHWWCEKPDGTIIDPSKAQFPSVGKGRYEVFNGVVECAQCGVEMMEEDAPFAVSRYHYCSSVCYGRHVGVIE